MELNKTAADLKAVMAFFEMDAGQMAKEWKRLDPESKVAIRNGIGDGSLTY